MQDETEKLSQKLEAVGEAASVDLTHYRTDEAQAEIELETSRDSVEVAMASEAARAMLRGAAAQLQDIADSVLVTGSDWLADAPNRIQAGESDVVREDHVYQSPDWERATGKKDNAINDLIG